jgi:hypothetical protein
LLAEPSAMPGELLVRFRTNTFAFSNGTSTTSTIAC